MHLTQTNSTRLVAWALGFTLVWLGAHALYFHKLEFWLVPFRQSAHLSIVLLFGLALLVQSTLVKGSLEDRLKQILNLAALTFGTYALAILLGRYFFSRVILATALPAALAISLMVVWRRQNVEGVKVGIIGPLVKTIPPGAAFATLIDDPRTDFRRYDMIVVDFHEPVSGEWSRALSRAMMTGCRVSHVEGYVEEVSGAASIDHFELGHLPATDRASYIQLKRLLDIVGAAILLPVALPLVIIGAVLVAATSPGPAFFIQDRAGRGGRPFKMWKLRTMRHSSPGREGEAAVPGDDRVTRVGRFLRRTRIDELPQLFNVLKGDMSLIGPRPEALTFHTAYTDVYPKFAYRCLVRPGITGWAQVNAPPSANAEEALNKLKYDLFYVKQQSLALDLQIVIRTLWTVVHGSGVR